MYEGKSEELKKRGIHAISVRELRDMGFHLQYDYSIIKYVEKNRMILITEDQECYDGKSVKPNSLCSFGAKSYH